METARGRGEGEQRRMGGGEAETGRWARGREKEEFQREISAGSVLWVGVWECFVAAVGQNARKI